MSRIKLLFYTLWPFSWAMISTTFLVTLSIYLSPFASGGKRNVLPDRSVGSKVGISLDPDGFSSSLDLMRTIRIFCFVEEPSIGTIHDPAVSFLFRRVKRYSNLTSMWCKPMVGSRRFLKANCTSIDNLGFMVQELVGYGITTMLPKTNPVASPLFTSRRKMLVMCCIEHWLIESEK